jgi:Ca-activated chloride channel family protein
VNALVWQPILPVGLVIAAAVVLLGFTGWRVFAERRNRALAWSWIRRSVVVALLLLIVCRPGLPGGTSRAATADLNVFFVVDTTSSVAAEDWDGDKPRLDGVRSDIESITNQLAGARFSLLSFDSTAIQRVPLTNDTTAVVTAAKAMRQEVTYYSHGSTISEANTLVANVLKGAKKSDPKRANIVYYLGDGEQTAATKPGSFVSSKPNVDGGGVLGYGTSRGGRMKEFDGYGDEYSANRYIKDTTRPGDPDAVSHIDQTTLRAIASELGVPYLHRVAGASLASVVDPEKSGHVVTSAGRTASVFDLSWIPAIPLFLLLFVDIAIVVGALGDVRPPRRDARRSPPVRRRTS